MPILDVQAYSLVHATTRALYAKLLPPETWEKLVGVDDYDGILSILSKTEYAPHLEIDRNLLTPRRAVYQIKWRLTHAYEKLIRQTPAPGRGLLLEMWRLYEVDNLKATLRGIETGASWNQVLFLLFPMSRHTALTTSVLERMVRTGDIEGAIRLIEDTPYYVTLDHALERYRLEESLFPLEVALDLDYYRRLWQDAEQLSGLDHEWAMRTVGNLIDMNNLLWAIRYRVYHRLSEEEIINYTFPFGHRVHDDDIREIASGSDIAEVVQRIYPDIAGLDESLADPQAGLVELERRLKHRIIEFCRDAFSGYPFQIGIPIGFLMLAEQEIENLTVLIEAKASNLSPNVFRPLLDLP